MRNSKRNIMRKDVISYWTLVSPPYHLKPNYVQALEKNSTRINRLLLERL